MLRLGKVARCNRANFPGKAVPYSQTANWQAGMTALHGVGRICGASGRYANGNDDMTTNLMRCKKDCGLAVQQVDLFTC